jgi:thiosulfate dehydrogenase [quinone] large subunit
MSTTVTPPATLAPASRPASLQGLTLGRRWLHGAAVVRILFGLLWAIDALFKWLPGFVNGQTLTHELGGAAGVSLPVEHQWLQLWNTVGLADPSLFAHILAVIETLAAIALIFGVFSNVALIGSAILSFGIWSGAEGMHLPWFQPGQTDLGPSVGYIFASLGLFFAAAGATWSLDAVIAPKVSRARWLFSRVAR